MKKVIAAVLIAAIMLCACGNLPSTQDMVGKNLDLDLSMAEVIIESDTHGGFHGDGETVIQLRVGDISEQIKGKPGWNETPVADELLPYTLRFGAPQDVYWYFFDRHREAEDRYDPTAISGRFSYNYTFAFYEPESGILTFYKLDT